ncbi:hypothetical protein METP3_01413 [Methanosarcinales archaeon]|nr:hypothetical protein METP3_01413 [Methanosarcinales archaeon]
MNNAAIIWFDIFSSSGGLVFFGTGRRAVILWIVLSGNDNWS